ncbi:hypothetical protein [Caulobacter endophyticus]|uniref:Uncharacterized protein n=1 Tax=Caulobacter endophyticus TaxID=2172652 RepID=A0A2T9K3V3_9CAUL|nr:hypothetical protein [Caulobacter endophyticus]PVM90666.1 hypothetical protein DDF67_09550 [Caulobacter endophyticus]
MPWVEFTARFDWTPPKDRRRTTVYRPGHMLLVTTPCATAAIAAGAAHRIATPRRGQQPVSLIQANPVRED